MITSSTTVTLLFIAAALPSALLVFLGAALFVQFMRGRAPAPVKVEAREERRRRDRPS